MKSFDDKVVANIRQSTKLDLETYNMVLGNKKFDFIVFVLDTDYDDKSEQISKYISKLSERFKFLGIKSTHIATFDVNEYGIHNKFNNVNLTTGTIFFYSAKK